MKWISFPPNHTEALSKMQERAQREGRRKTAAPPHAAGPLGTAPKGRKGDVQSSDWTHTHGDGEDFGGGKFLEDAPGAHGSRIQAVKSCSLLSGGRGHTGCMPGETDLCCFTSLIVAGNGAVPRDPCSTYPSGRFCLRRQDKGGWRDNPTLAHCRILTNS